MLGTSARLLRLLSLLQARADWSGAELADELEVTARTVRNDIQRLRDLGYPVHASPGVGGGYRLGAREALPPLPLHDVGAGAVAGGLRHAGRGGGGGCGVGGGAPPPPLLLDDEAAVAVAVVLRTAAGGAVAGIEET